MLAVEERLVEGLHATDHGLMTIFLSCIQIFLVSEDTIGIGKSLVDTTMLPAQDILHLTGSQFRYHVHGPVAHVLV